MVRPRPGRVVARGNCLLHVDGNQPNAKGYVKSTVGGRRDYVHRHAWREVHGEIPSGLHVLHTCDVPHCVNVSHLFLGNNHENMQDAARKGRISTQRLTEKQVLEIRRRAETEKLTALAKEFEVTVQNIWRIVHRRTWRWLS